MATSSFSKDFVIDDQQSVEQLIEAMENPVEITLPKQDLAQEVQRKQDILCQLDKRLALLNL